ncbi:hypothetical protein [Hyphomonas sp.]|uniref:hypothetical protein n=1 Tax=Hyphomonas sp. TaxID=87 RepID=UPI0030017FB6
MARSPSYPQISLENCIDLVRKVYKGAHTASVDTQAVMKEMGYAGRSGRSLAAIGSLKQFGLLEGRDDAIRVTKAALALLEPLNEAEFSEAVRDASVRPDLFAELHREFGDQRPSEGVIRSIAIRKYGFTDTGSERLARSYMETMEFVQQYKKAPEPVDETRRSSETKVPTESQPIMKEVSPGLSISEPVTLSHAKPTGMALVFQLSPTSSAQVYFKGPVTPAVIERLIKHLELSKEAFVEEA